MRIPVILFILFIFSSLKFSESSLINQKNYLIKFYSLYIPRDSNEIKFYTEYRSKLIKNINHVVIEHRDSIEFNESEVGIVGLYSEPFNRILISKNEIFTDSYRNVYCHELTHAAFKGISYIPISNINTFTSCIGKPKTIEAIINWEYITNHGELQARIMASRYELGLYNFTTRKYDSYEVFIHKMYIEKHKKHVDANIEVLESITDSYECLYELITKTI